MKKNLQRFGASVLAAAMVAQSVALPAAAETTKIDSSVAQSVAASAASAASAVQSLPKFTSTADLIKQTAQTLAAQGEVHELEQDDAKLEATAQSKAGMSLAALENALADAMYANAAAGKINTEAYGLNKDEMASVMAATIKTYHLSSAVTDLGYDRPEATAKALQVHADGKTWLHTGDIGYMSEDGVLYTMTRGASPRFGGGDLMVQPLENIVADADIKGIKDEFFVIVPDDEHEGCFLPYLYVQLKDGYTLDDVRDKINACLPERYMRPVEIFTVPERPFFHFKTNRIGLSKEIIAKRNQQKEKAKRNSFADGCIA